MARTEVVAMILAGGQGSRLGVLTKTVAKPAVRELDGLSCEGLGAGCGPGPRTASL